MLTVFLLTVYSLVFFFFAWRYFKYAVGTFIILLPAYLLRFTIFHLPSTLLELTFGLLLLVWLIHYSKTGFKNLASQITAHKLFFIFFSLFFVASIAGVFISDMWWYSLGQWRAYFLEPMILFLMLIGMGEDLTSSSLITPLIISTLSISIFGIIQRFTGWYIGNADTVALAEGRTTSFFLSPNDVGLYIAPLIPLMIYLLFTAFKKIQIKKCRVSFFMYLLFLFLALAALFLSQSLGAFVGLAVGGIVFLFLLGYKKIAFALIVAGIFGFSLIYLHSPIKIRSFGNRLTLWTYTDRFLTASPKNFIFGAGIRQFFRKIQKPYYHVGGNLERLIYPHNIFLNFWSEIGLFGMLAFIGLFVFLLLYSYKNQKRGRLLSATLLFSLTIIFIHGLVDVPYFKNDLAMLWWILAAIIFKVESNKKLTIE